MREFQSLLAEDRVGTFKFLLDRFCELAGREGITLIPYEVGGPRWFRELQPQAQVMTLSHFHRYFEAARETVENSAKMRDDNHFLWRMFTKLGVHPSADLMDHIDTGDIVEIYDADFVQVFRNLAFFSICSYTLDELLCRPFWELFRRDEKLTGELMGILKEVYAGQRPGTNPWNKGVHVVDETSSLARYHAVTELKKVSPLYNSDGKVVAIVNTLRVVSCVPTLVGGRPITPLDIERKQ